MRRKRLNLLEGHSHSRLRVNRKSSKRVHDGEGWRNIWNSEARNSGSFHASCAGLAEQPAGEPARFFSVALLDTPELLPGEETRAVEIARHVRDSVNEKLKAYLAQ